MPFTGSVGATAAVTFGAGTTGAPGNIIREDLSDVYKLLAVTETPFMSRSGDKSVNAVFAEWTEDALSAPADSAVLEGNASTRAAIPVPLRLRNVCQINEKVPEISGTGDAVDLAGIDDAMAWATAKRTKELKRDMEQRATLSCWATAATTTPVLPSGALVHRGLAIVGKTRSLVHFIAADADRNDGLGVAPCLLSLPATVAVLPAPGVETDVGTPPTAAVLVLLTLAHINTAKQKNYVAGGSANTLLVSANIKSLISGLYGKTGQQSNVDKHTLSTNVTLIETPFGDLKVVPDVFMSDQVVIGLDPEASNIGWLRKVASVQLAKTGDTDAKLVNGEWCVRPDAIRAHFAIVGCKAS